MNFDLKKPCKDCPFRSDIKGYLTKARVKDILFSIMENQGTFSCHKTNEFDDDGEVVEEGQHCAGALIFLEKQGMPNQMMRIAERLGMYDRRKLDMTAPVFSTRAQMIKKQPVR